ncbi:leucine-rich repeat-containing protein 15-like [Onthophagus taurus]|uniref:leucine-rich repeat-containing protein 15-like n=1 Tax=Onthophagus taurus TaxID=166361 RepID=UPI000C205C8C|nr:leucine-rich repeat-containing protein 15-like [Onthophagus taurus]
MVKVSVIAYFYTCALFIDTLVYGKPHGDVISTSLQILFDIPENKNNSIKINYSYNEINRLRDYVFFNKNYAQAETIELFKNKISDISTFAFWGLEQLKVVDLSDNLITNLDDQTFTTNRNLHKLVLINNRITFKSHHKFLISESIETLVLSNNRINKIYDSTFEALPKLRRLLLTDNALTEIENRSFQSLTNLRYLSLANTGVIHLSDSMFNTLPHIINLDDTPIAQNFDPPLRQVRGHAIKHLLQLESGSREYILHGHHNNINKTDPTTTEINL